MSRHLYIVAASLLLLSLFACGVAFVPNPLQPSLPVNGSLLKTVSLLLFLASLIAALAAVMTTMFEQVARRNQERMRRELDEDLARISRHNRRS
jgi:hypothetical protein